MKMGNYIGHTSEEGRQQLLIDHLKGTVLLLFWKTIMEGYSFFFTVTRKEMTIFLAFGNAIKYILG